VHYFIKKQVFPPENEHDAGGPQAYWMKKCLPVHIKSCYSDNNKGIFTIVIIWYDDCRRTKKGRPRGGSVT
jgi:hypothetical protein